MSQPDFADRTDAGRCTGFGPRAGSLSLPSATELVTAAAQARSAGWTAAAAVDLGDTHEKGEVSLCVGEAA